MERRNLGKVNEFKRLWLPFFGMLIGIYFLLWLLGHFVSVVNIEKIPEL